MATTKKATPKKTTARKAVVAKKPAVKAAGVKHAGVRKSSKASVSEMRSFRVFPEPTSFTTFKITRQTVYWVVLVAFIIFVQLWIIKLQVEVAALVDQQQSDSLISQ